MEVVIAQIVNGLSMGSVYALLVTGFNLLILAAMIIHFSFPATVVFSMYAAWLFMQWTGSVAVGIAAAIGSAALVNMISAPVFQRVTEKRGSVDINATMIVSMGMGMLITELCSHSINKGFPVSFPLLSGARKPFWQSGFISLSYAQAAALGGGIVAAAVLFRILYRTRAGRAFRAIAENPGEAQLAGIPVFRTALLSYALAGALGGVSAALMAPLLGSASSDLGDLLSHKVLGVSIIAGLGNLWGGLAAALLLGVVEALVQGFFSGSWSNAVVFVIMLGVVLLKPRGVFGARL
ncbi:MAG: branched-chain amino acid ABC transporter permease [Treponema sp.]|nr:branched-chain amino acid ABC transporter permease [Treponema sp.]